MALTLVSLLITHPVLPATAGSVVLVLASTSPPTVTLAGVTVGYVPLQQLPGGDYSITLSGIPAGPHTLFAAGGDGGMESLSHDFTVNAAVAPPPPVVLAAPSAQAAAFLPMVATLEVAPATLNGVLSASAALLVVEVLDAGVWREVGKHREVADAANKVRCDLSEYVNTQFTNTPPNETGDPDPALAVRYRARYGVGGYFTGAPGTEAGTISGLALNAAEVFNPEAAPLPYSLPPTPVYQSVPVGYARFQSVVNVGGTAVTNLPLVAESASDWPCPVRQFVWLHPSGAWAWGFFTGKHEHGDEAAGTLVRRGGGVERYVSRGDVRARITAYSDVTDWATYQVLRTIRTSVQVYERLASGAYVPVVLEPGAFPGYKETDKTFTVDFTARYPVQVRQTQ